MGRRRAAVCPSRRVRQPNRGKGLDGRVINRNSLGLCSGASRRSAPWPPDTALGRSRKRLRCRIAAAIHAAKPPQTALPSVRQAPPVAPCAMSRCRANARRSSRRPVRLRPGQCRPARRAVRQPRHLQAAGAPGLRPVRHRADHQPPRAADIAAVKTRDRGRPQGPRRRRRCRRERRSPIRSPASSPNGSILRCDNTTPTFQRYAAFVNDQSGLAARRRCSAAAPRTRCGTTGSTTPRCSPFSPTSKPTTAKGRYMLARALLAKGDRAGAAALVRHAWRYAGLQRRRRKQGARHVRRPAHARRPQGAHGAALLRGRHRGRHARGAAARRRRISRSRARAPA